MALHIEAICTDPDLLDQDSREHKVRVIGEILPFVLAKYCLETQPTPRQELRSVATDCSSRFAGV